MTHRVRIHLIDGQTILVGFDDIQLRDAHNRRSDSLTLQEAEALLNEQPEPQRTSCLDLLARHHRPAQ